MTTFFILYLWFVGFFLVALALVKTLDIIHTAAQRRADQRRLLDQMRAGGAVRCTHERARQIERALFREPRYRTHPAPADKLQLTPYVKPITKHQ